MGDFTRKAASLQLEESPIDPDLECLLDRAEDGQAVVLAPQTRTRGRDFWRAACWTICSATALLTSKSLMVSHNYHYPHTIAFRSLASIFLVYVAIYQWNLETTQPADAKRHPWGLRLPEGGNFLLNFSWIYMVPASLAAAATLPLILQGVLHLPSLSVLVMLFPIIYAAESLLLFICCSVSRSPRCLPWEAVFIVGMTSMVLLNEYRLMVPGLVQGVPGILLIGVARALFTLGSDRSGTELATEAWLHAYHGFVIMSLTLGMIFSGIMAFFKERVESTHPFHYSTLPLTVLNLIAFIGTAFSGTSVLAYSPISFDDSRPGFSSISLPSPEFLTSSGGSILLFLLTIRLDSTSSISWVQVLAYLGATFCLGGIDRLHECTLQGLASTQENLTKAFRMESNPPRKPSRALTLTGLLFSILFLTATLSHLSSTILSSLSAGPIATFDLQYKASTRFEIVVSIFDEDPASVRHMLNKFLSTTPLLDLSPKITVYTKDQSVSLSNLKVLIGASEVYRLQNLGREGGTYLHHIINRWDDLADQTLFIQAHAHNLREVIPRVNNYLVPETGMLSLGFTGVNCPCGSCGDRWGWEDTDKVVPELYREIYGKECQEEENILLSYKGQFIASARRIRGISKNIYKNLLNTLTANFDDTISNNTNSGSFGGNIEPTGGTVGDNTPDNPTFGFSMERIWGLLLQCGTDERIMAKCPSLLSGTIRRPSREEVGECQCLDILEGIL